MSSSRTSHRKRKQAKRRFLRTVARASWISKCHWCGKPIVWATRIPTQSVIKVHRKDYITVNLLGKAVRMFIATIDHVVPLRDGGANDRSNLVASCRPCNMLRTKTPKTRPPICVDCGGPKTGRGRRRCKKCQLDRAVAHFAALPTDDKTLDRIIAKSLLQPDGVMAKVVQRLRPSP